MFDKIIFVVKIVYKKIMIDNLQLVLMILILFYRPYQLLGFIMTSKTTAAYTAVLNHFSQVFAPHINPSSVSVDFEEGLSSAIDAIFPNAKIIRCYFHFLNASMRNLKKKKRNEIYGAIKRLARKKLMGIPLLPQEHMVLAFNWLLTNTVDDVKEQFTDFIKYFEGWWIKRVTPIKLSVFLTEKVTNNEIEAYHRVLRKRMGSHPSIWQLMEYLKNLQSVTRSEWGSLMMGLSIRQPTENKYINKKEILHRAWKMYQDKLLDIPKFLACAYNFLGCLQKFTYITESLHVDLLNVNLYRIII
ncbi:Protein of unknown function [Cotesia congregata]|uniref:MULE transposase domain-containing protein n=1 Tax=Cotesia congregata TaxID=51543 RepID=A0A8J2MJ37_COTCN|nr:Protein of unknown function [Cotesia congregata]